MPSVLYPDLGGNGKGVLDLPEDPTTENIIFSELASTAFAKGASLIGVLGGGTVQSALAAFALITAPTIIGGGFAGQTLADRIAPLTENHAIFIDGGVASSLGLPRDDFGIVIKAPTAGAAGQRHALMGFVQQHTDDEWGLAGYHNIPTLGWIQTGTMFSALEDHDDDAATYCGYTGFHGVSNRFDCVPLVMYYDNRVEVLGSGMTVPALFDRKLTSRDVFHNFFNSYLQGWTVLGVHAQAVQGTNTLEVNGPAFFGAVDSGTLVSTTGLHLFWHTVTNKAFIQAYSYVGAGSLQNLVFNCTGLEVSCTSLSFFGAAKVAQQALAAVATDPASTQTLANSLRTAMINYGLGV